MSALDKFISRLYRSTQHINIEHFRSWALGELQNLITFDSAIWSTGHLSTRTFHTHTTINLPLHFPDLTIEYLPINPISKKLFNHVGEAVRMDDVVDDYAFYKSEIYSKMFEPHKIERVLSSIHISSRSGIYTLLSIYRSNRDHKFSDEEKNLQTRALTHLIDSASHACLLSLEPSHKQNISHNAICDRHGIYHEVEDTFLDIIEENFSAAKNRFPLNLPLENGSHKTNSTVFNTSPLGDLYRITARQLNVFDQLTQRESEVVNGVTNGLSFKQIAKNLNLSPSTVSNHLYRIYQKLNIANRGQLADLIQEQSK